VIEALECSHSENGPYCVLNAHREVTTRGRIGSEHGVF
jgi:hypothetical protein